MGQALAQAFIAMKIVKANQLRICDRHLEKLQQLKEVGVEIFEDTKLAVHNSDIVILAIKPKDVQSVLLEIKDVLSIKTLIISICAGIRISSITDIIGTKVSIVRAMPNTPVKVGAGMTGWYCNSLVTSQNKKTVKTLFTTLGKELEVSEEKLIDVITAVSGSGPAYFYFFLEAMIQGGLKLGLTQDESVHISLQTFIGAAELLKQTGSTPESLRRAVTSKGGTTEAALQSFQNNNLPEIVSEAMNRAYLRAQELSSKK